jgi:tRNA G18 (ribose-2'-O)-methylase SpoU
VPPENVIQITHADDPRVADFVNLKDAQLRAREHAGLHARFIAEGEQVVRHLAASRFPMLALLVSPAGLRRLQADPPTLPQETPIYLAPEPVLQRIVGFEFHRGILACGGRVPDPPALDLARDRRTLVVCEDLTNADNVGAVFRNVAALSGVGSGVLLTPGCCDPLYRKAIRVSMGQALRVPFARLEPWPDGLAALAGLGFRVLALTPGPDALDIGRVHPVGRIALVVGTEGRGLTEAALARCEQRVRIPMSRGVDSLNVGVALGVALSRLVTPA